MATIPATSAPTKRYANEPALQRDAEKASRCIHLSVDPVITVGLQPIDPKRHVQLAGANGEQRLARVVMGIPPLSMICKSPAVLDRVRVKNCEGAPDLAEQIVQFTTSLDVCQVCPFWDGLKAETIQ